MIVREKFLNQWEPSFTWHILPSKGTTTLPAGVPFCEVQFHTPVTVSAKGDDELQVFELCKACVVAMVTTL